MLRVMDFEKPQFMSDSPLSLTMTKSFCVLENLTAKMSLQNGSGETVSKISKWGEEAITVEGKPLFFPYRGNRNFKENTNNSRICMFPQNFVHLFGKLPVMSSTVKSLEQPIRTELEKTPLMPIESQNTDLNEQLRKLGLEDKKCADEMQVLRSHHDQTHFRPDSLLATKDSISLLRKPLRCFRCSSFFKNHKNFSRHKRLFLRFGKCQISEADRRLLILEEEEYSTFHLRPKTLKPEDLIRNMAAAGTTHNSYACRMCHEQFSNKTDLNLHRFYHLQEGTFIPLNANKHLFKSWRQMKKNISKVCHECKMPFQKLVCNHYFKKTLTNSYICNFCDRKYNAKICIQRHVKIHLLKREQGADCEFFFSHENSVTCHLKELTCENETRPFLCELCHIGFSEAHLLSKHNEVHLKFKQDADHIATLAEMLDKWD